jgi:chitinase
VGVVVDAWIDAGVPANKLVLGLPFHGRSWLLKNAADHDILSKANGAATDINQYDPIPYRRIQELVIAERGVEVIDHYYVTQYCYFGTTWIGYDGKDIISYKVIYAKQKKLLGYFAWHLDGDDSDWTLSKQGNYFITVISLLDFYSFKPNFYS